MDEFRIALISIGIFAIVGILAHGMWTIRKNNKLKEEQQNPRDSQHREPEVVISDDDPLLGGNALSSNEPSSKQASDSMSAPSAASHHEEDHDTHSEQLEHDPLVGDVPLYDSSDIAFTNKTVSATQSVSSIREAETPTTSQQQAISQQKATAQETAQHYDEDGIGSVRVLADKPVAEPEVAVSKANSPETADPIAEDDELPEPPGYLLRKDGPKEHHASMDKKSINRLSAEDMPMIDTSIDIDDSPRGEKRSGALKSEHTRTEVVGGNRLGKKAESITEKAKKLVGLGPETKEVESSKEAPATKTAKRTRPDPNKDQIRLDLESTPEAESDNTVQNQDENPASENEVLILNVRVPEGKVIQGAALLPSLLTLGFKFGDHNMFHRHAASNGKGPRLFTLANMFNPGTFDIDNMENFNTTGVSLFMTLPIDADAHQVFNMMHNAARKLADEFGAQVLDGRRSVLTRQSLQQYVEKIREFERRRMIRRGG